MTLRNRIIAVAATLGAMTLPVCSQANEPPHTEHEAMARDIYAKVIAMDTSVLQHGTPQMASYLAGLFREAGFAAKDVMEIVISPDQTSLVVRYPGSDTDAKAIGFMAHMDVVPALQKDWELNPYTLIERGGYFIGRGTADNKAGVVGLTTTFLKLKKSGYLPDRTMILTLTSDEETGMTAARHIAREMQDELNIEYAINSDALSGVLMPDGNLFAYYVQGAEKTYHTVTLTVKNPGGHSSAPRPDNAIYQLSRALMKIEAYRFPATINEITAGMLKFAALRSGKETATAIEALLADPTDQAAADIVSADPISGTVIRTTCVATMLDAGHAENALPQSATAKVNCRIMPNATPQEIEDELVRIIDDPQVEISSTRQAGTSPASPMREDVMSAIKYAIVDKYPDANLVPFMASYGTEAKAFGEFGIPVYGSSGTFMNPAEAYAHGLNEKIPVVAFYDSLDYWERLMKRLTVGTGE